MTQIYCASPASDFDGDVSSEAQILSVFSTSRVSYSFCYCLKWNLLLEMFARICELSFLEQVHQETFVIFKRFTSVVVWTLQRTKIQSNTTGIFF